LRITGLQADEVKKPGKGAASVQLLSLPAWGFDYKIAFRALAPLLNMAPDDRASVARTAAAIDGRLWNIMPECAGKGLVQERPRDAASVEQRLWHLEDWGRNIRRPSASCARCC
jgi:hypothetical protein